MNQIKLHAYGCTDIGLNRLYNEDYFDMNDFFFVLADGMGGHKAGDVASKSAVDHIMSFIKTLDDSKINKYADEMHVQKIISDAIKKTNETVFNEALKDKDFEGMGTTLVLALFQKPHTMHIANVGDSRAYLLRNEQLNLLTEDHSITATMVREGTISQNEANKHPYRHHLTRSIGTTNQVEVFTNFFHVFPEDKILLCTDGLWDVLADEKIKELLQKHSNPEKICNTLLFEAKKLQSNDNISSIAITVSKK